MISSTTYSKSNRPLPDDGDIAALQSLVINNLAALSNHVQQLAVLFGPVGAPYSPISVAITRKSSGLFLVWWSATISQAGDAGSIADGDAVVFTTLRGVTPISPTTVVGASTANGGGSENTVTATGSQVVLDNPGISLGGSVGYSIEVVSANAHSSGVLANAGVINVLELPG